VLDYLLLENKGNNKITELRAILQRLCVLFLLIIALSVPFIFTASDYHFGIFRLLAIALSVPFRFTASDYHQPENCENRNDPDLVQAFLKKWWVESDLKAPNLPLSLQFKGSGCHYNSI
jgi:hypothetical protein